MPAVMIRLLVIGLLVLAGGACLPLWWREAPPAGAVTVACACWAGCRHWTLVSVSVMMTCILGAKNTR